MVPKLIKRLRWIKEESSQAIRQMCPDAQQASVWLKHCDKKNGTELGVVADSAAMLAKHSRWCFTASSSQVTRELQVRIQDNSCQLWSETPVYFTANSPQERFLSSDGPFMRVHDSKDVLPTKFYWANKCDTGGAPLCFIPSHKLSSCPGASLHRSTGN